MKKTFFKHFFLLFAFLLVTNSMSAQWFHDNMETAAFLPSVAPNPWINTTAASNPPGVTNSGVAVVGGGTGTAMWNGGWDGVSTGTTAFGSSYTWQTSAGTSTGVTFTYTLPVTGTASISSMSFGMRRNSIGNTNLAVSINGTSYTPSTSTMGNTSWTPVTVTVSPTRNYTTGQTITIVLAFTGGTGSPGVVQRIDELRLFGSSAAPVEMTEFTVQPSPVGFDLKWHTSTEKDNLYFAVERSHDGQSYSEIARIDGAGNSTIEQIYQFTDEKPLKGDNYYRLKQVDIDGQSDYSPVRIAANLPEDTYTLQILDEKLPISTQSFIIR